MAFAAIAAVIVGLVSAVILVGLARARLNHAIGYSTEITKAMDITRSAQVNFKIQVQEWKNTLLRGNNPAMFEKYWTSFGNYEKQVLADLEQVKKYFISFGIDPTPVIDAIEEEKWMGTQYRDAIKKYRKDNFRSAFIVDKGIRGIDREPTENIENLVKIMEKSQDTLFSEIRSQTISALLLSLVFSILGGVISGVAIFVLFKRTIASITTPLGQTIKIFNSIANENLTNKIDQSRRDEIGEMWRALNRMQNSLLDRTQALNASNHSLQRSLKEVQSLKEEQDGDYFLTSLLLSPLGSNKVNSDNIKVEFFTRQKKQFKFRKWSKEIGGDISIANSLVLKNKEYAIIINADAMGKSIQGAGGAIVFGSVFTAILERTRLSEIYSNISPERWLKNTVIELHKVFESFDGSMLISMVMCLIENESGLLYYVNSEHPRPILFRDNVADFMEEVHYLPKLGTPDSIQDVYINTFKLQENDVLILGSDGRDDLDLAGPQAATRIINEDETLILDIVRSAKCDLSMMILELEEKGSLTDDLSLVKISFSAIPMEYRNELTTEATNKIVEFYDKKGEAPHKRFEILAPLLKKDERHPEVLKALVHHYFGIKEYENACRYAIDYALLRTDDTEFLYIVSYLAKLSGQFELAIDYGERMRLRTPNHVRNLVNLSDCYLLIKQYDRALHLVSEAQHVDPENEKVAKLAEKVKRKKEKHRLSKV